MSTSFRINIIGSKSALDFMETGRLFSSKNEPDRHKATVIRGNKPMTEEERHWFRECISLSFKRSIIAIICVHTIAITMGIDQLYSGSFKVGKTLSYLENIVTLFITSMILLEIFHRKTRFKGKPGMELPTFGSELSRDDKQHWSIGALFMCAIFITVSVQMIF